MAFFKRPANLAAELLKLHLIRSGYSLWSERRPPELENSVFLEVHNRAAKSFPHFYPKCALLVTTDGTVGVYKVIDVDGKTQHVDSVKLFVPGSLGRLNELIDEATQIRHVTVDRPP